MAKDDLNKRTITHNDVIKVGGKETTVGRLMIGERLPESFRKQDDLLHDPKFVLKKKDIRRMMGELAKSDPKQFSITVDALKDLGNQHSYDSGFSFSLNDLKVPKAERNAILAKYDAEAKKVTGPKIDRDRQLVDIYTKANQELGEKLLPHFEKADNHIYRMV